MTPAQMRASAKALRAQARQLDLDAAAAEAAERYESQRRALAEKAASAAKAGCAPVWAVAPKDTAAVVVKGIVDGQFRVGEPGHDRSDRLFSVRTGWERGNLWSGRIDAAATLAAWRAWCAARRGSP